VSKISIKPVPPPSAVGPLTVTDFVIYQGASGDLASIHHDFGVARSAGYDMPFAPGMYPAGVLASWATAWLGARNMRRFKVRFVSMVWPGDILTCEGSIASIEEDGRETTIKLELRCHSQHELALLGWATFVIPAAEIG
jgi:acyl dehydratase